MILPVISRVKFVIWKIHYDISPTTAGKETGSVLGKETGSVLDCDVLLPSLDAKIL